MLDDRDLSDEVSKFLSGFKMIYTNLVSILEDLEVKDGKLVDSDKVEETIKSNWSELITKTETKGANVENPPKNSGSKQMNRDEIMAITDRTERREAIRNNPQAFGK